MADVFISYKREDHPTVQAMVQGLRGQGLAVWWDQDIPPDAPWELTVERELAAAGAVIVAWSNGSVESENVKAEARRARHAGKLIQVFLEHCEPPLFFGERQGVNLRGWTGDVADHRFQTMLAAARAVAAGKRPPQGVGYAPPTRRPPQTRWAAIVGAALAVSLGLGLVLNLGGARAALCGLSAAQALCHSLGAAAAAGPAPAPDPAALAAQARAKLIQSITGAWDIPKGSCATPLSVSASTLNGVTRLTVADGKGPPHIGQVDVADNGEVVSRDITPEKDGTRTVWEWRPNGDMMTVTDNANITTNFVRCPAKS